MKLIFGSTLLLIFTFLSALHFYWAAGGKRWLEAAVPETTAGKATFEPPLIATLAVAIGLLAMGMLALVLALVPVSSVLEVSGWVIAGIFLLRAIGDFRYAGFTKRVHGTRFAQRDTRIYSPLCLFISITQTALLLW